ncbi:MAG TPA: hypothetical protein VIL36_20695 [Acidimicrobiales bacterium]
MAARSLAGYLALPRPDEARAKMPLAALGYGLVHVAGAPDAVPPTTALVAWVVFELVLYQARYMLNDLADAEVDRQHVAAEGRKRLPPGAHARRWSAAVLVARIVLGLAAVASLSDPARRVTLVAALGVAVATAAYEAARAPMRRAVRDGGAGPAVRPDRPLFLRRRGALAVVVLVGAGYAIRVGLGVALAGASGAVVAAAVALGWLFGTLGVVGAWLLEVAGLRQGDDTTVLASKAHLATMAELLGDDPARHERPCLRGGGAHLVAGLLAAATVAAVLVGVGLGGSPGAARVALLVVLAAGVAPALLVVWPSPWAGAVAVALAVGAGGLLATGDGRAEMVLLLAVVVTTPAVYRNFTPAALHLQPGPSARSAQPSGRPGRPTPSPSGAAPASPTGSDGAPPGDPGVASPAATTARPRRRGGRAGAAARSRPGSEPAGRP